MPEHHSKSRDATQVIGQLKHWFGVDFSLIDLATDRAVHSSAGPANLDERVRDVCVEWFDDPCPTPRIIDDAPPWLVLALPLSVAPYGRCAAVATFVSRNEVAAEELTAMSQRLQMPRGDVAAWLGRQPEWSPEALLRLASSVLELRSSREEVAQLESEVRQLSDKLGDGFEEISLLYMITENLGTYNSVEELVAQLLDELVEFLPAEAVAIQLLPAARDEHGGDVHGSLLTWGNCPVDDAQFARLVQQWGDQARSEPLVVNTSVTGKPSWDIAGVRHMVLVPIEVRGQVTGWLAAINHADDGWFGSIQARLLNCVATILGVHGDNLDLYRQRAEMVSRQQASDSRLAKLADEVGQLSATLDMTCEEVSRTFDQINVLHRMAHQLGTSDDEEQLGRLALDCLGKLLPVESLALQFLTVQSDAGVAALPDERVPWLTTGNCPLDERGFRQLVNVLELRQRFEPLVANASITGNPGWQFPEIRQLVIVPLVAEGRLFGWLAAMNHRHQEELGTVEASVMSSVAALMSLFCTRRRQPSAVAGPIRGGRVQPLAREVERLKEENLLMCLEVSRSYEEMRFLYRVIERLRDGCDFEELLRLVLDWLVKVLPSEGVALQISLDAKLPADKEGRADSSLLTWGNCSLDDARLQNLVAGLKLDAHSGPLVINRTGAPHSGWQYPEVRQFLVVPLASGDHYFGWLAAVNHAKGNWFGTIEASLMASVATILGLQSDNLELYHQQVSCLTDRLASEQKAEKLEHEVEELSLSLAASYEEIHLLHELAQKQRSCANLEQVSELIMGWLSDVIPVKGVALWIADSACAASQSPPSELGQLFTRGEFPLDVSQLAQLVQQQEVHDSESPLVVNESVTQDARWPYPEVQHMILTPFFAKDRIAGWLVVVNHDQGCELGSGEARLLCSAGSILGTHSLLNGSVRDTASLADAAP